MFSLKSALACTLAAAALMPATAHAWTKTFQVSWIEPAFYYGGPESGSPVAKGTDCPAGVHEMDWEKLLSSAYTKEQIATITDPEYSRPMFLTHLGFRGPNKEWVYESPTSVPDPGMTLVTGKIAEGFDLDDNPKTGFTGIDGQQGVDNVYYKLLGCSDYYRGKARESYRAKSTNDGMSLAMSLLVVISGEKDPMNDDNVTVGIYGSKDRPAKDGAGNLVPDYSFKVDPNDQTVFKAKVTNGVIESVGRPSMAISYNARVMPSRIKTILYQSKVRFEPQPDGTMRGMLGGYVDLKKLYLEHNVSSYVITASQTENLGHINMPGLFYAMRREADGLPDPATGKNRGISAAYRMELIPAFVIDPGNGKAVNVAQLFE